MNEDQPMAKCELCGRWKPLVLLQEHLEDDHGYTEGIEEWPDGSLVIIDKTLTPEDFNS